MDVAIGRPEPEDVVRSPRPGGLLTAAAAVPLGVAVLLAAGHLPGGARAVVGVAVVVLGLALLRTHGTVTGARLGPGVSDALGAIVAVTGVGLVAGALVVGVDGAEGGGPGGWGAALFWLVLAATAVGLLGAPRGGRATMRAAEALLGVSLAVAFAALLGPGALGLGATARTVVVLAAAAAAVGAVAVTRADAGGPRVGIVVAGVLLALVAGEATTLVGTITGHVLPGDDAGGGSGFEHLRTPAVLLITTGLLVVATRRRSVVGAVLGGAVLVGAGGGGPSPALVLLVPVAGLVLTGVLAASPPARAGVGRLLARLVRAPGDGTVADTGDDADDADGRGGAPVPRDAALAALAVALVAAGAALLAAYPDAAGAAVVSLLLVAGAATAGALLPGTPGVVAASAAVAAVGTLQPLRGAVATLWRSTVESGVDSLPLAVAAAAQAAVVLALLLRRREAPVLALGAIVLAGQTGVVLLAAWPMDDGFELVPLLVATLGVPVLGLLAIAVLGLVGRSDALRPRQAVGAGLAYAAAAATQGAASFLPFASESGPSAPAVLEGADRVVALVLVVGLALGLALLAATVARRPSVAVTAAVLLGTVQAALYAGVVGAAVRDGVGGGSTAPADPLLGFAAAGSGAAGSGAAWPLLFGVLGAVLLAAGWWLESRRPVPAAAHGVG